MNNLNLKLLLEIFILKMRFQYSEDVCNTFYDKAFNYLFKSSDEFKPLNESLLHLIAFSRNSFERKIMKKFYDFVKSYC